MRDVSCIPLRSVDSSAGRSTLAHTLAQTGAAERLAKRRRISLLTRLSDRSVGGSSFLAMSTSRSRGTDWNADSLPALRLPALRLPAVVVDVPLMVDVRRFLAAGAVSESSPAGRKRGGGRAGPSVQGSVQARGAQRSVECVP